MRKARFLKLVLLIFECLSFIAAFPVIKSSFGQASLPGIILMTSTALFPLMALFIWLDSTRYRVYIPLFLTGKCVGIFCLSCFSLFAGKVSIIDKSYNDMKIISALLFYYIFSMVFAILIFIREKNSSVENPSEEKKTEVE